MPAGSRQFIITGIREEVRNVRTIFIIPEDRLPVHYRAGQFLTLTVPHGGKEVRRSYSISSEPDSGEPLSFTVRRVDNGIVSRMLLDRAAPGDILSCIIPSGLFVLPDDTDSLKHIFFFAAGVGITPVFALLKAVLRHHPGIQVSLFYSTRTIAETVFYQALLQLRRQYPERFRPEFLCSTSLNLDRARLHKALVPLLVSGHADTPPASHLFYICGPMPYMRMCGLALTEAGYTEAQIRREVFNTYTPVFRQLPPDQGTHRVRLHTGSRSSEFEVRYPDSILSAARRNGIDYPFSCETGRCGSCAAKVISGKVWMSNNEVLMDRELAQGLVLTCTGHPVGGDAEIRLS